jgi:predicted nucleic acid-binding protein
LDDALFDQSKAEATDLFESIVLVNIDEPLLERACAVAEGHSLRAYDAVQLSALLSQGTEGLMFACWDDALRAAAATEGYTLFPA